MRRISCVTTAVIMMLISMIALTAWAAEEKGPLWVHSQCTPLPTEMSGPFVRLGDGRLLTIKGADALTSADEGKTWGKWGIFADPQRFAISSEYGILRTKNGVVIVAFINMKEQDWRWNSAKHDADPGTRLPTYAARSLDEGRTWEAPQKLHDEWTGCIRNIIQTKSGAVVFTSMKLLNNPGRHSVLTYVSKDDGATWRASNIIDLGGCGHHGGVTEATVVQLNDGRLWKLIRTNWGRFWEAFSEDDGISWRTIHPSTIEASSAPGQLLRLQSGALLLAWNRPFPEGKTEYPLTGGDNEWSEVPVSNHREELSVALSLDDGQTWSAPVVIARQTGQWLSYAYLFEPKPGLVWLTTMQGGVRVSFQVKDLFPATPSAP
ncbi:MAG TPA: sialidase family protein [Candidatus Hydrogenedentes bacterium]|nr:sialidase family protein [Candidatus Hydrogenedentota bacterium]